MSTMPNIACRHAQCISHFECQIYSWYNIKKINISFSSYHCGKILVFTNWRFGLILWDYRKNNNKHSRNTFSLWTVLWIITEEKYEIASFPYHHHQKERTQKKILLFQLPLDDKQHKTCFNTSQALFSNERPAIHEHKSTKVQSCEF